MQDVKLIGMQIHTETWMLICIIKINNNAIGFRVIKA